MRIDGQRRQPLGGGDILDVRAERSLVDRQVVVERQQDRRNDAVRQGVRVTRHDGLLKTWRVGFRGMSFGADSTTHARYAVRAAKSEPAVQRWQLAAGC